MNNLIIINIITLNYQNKENYVYKTEELNIDGKMVSAPQRQTKNRYISFSKQSIIIDHSYPFLTVAETTGDKSERLLV